MNESKSANELWVPLIYAFSGQLTSAEMREYGLFQRLNLLHTAPLYVHPGMPHNVTETFVKSVTKQSCSP